MTKKMYGVKGKRMKTRQCPGGKHLALKIWLLLPPNSSGTCLSTKGVESILHGEGGMHSTVPHEHVMLVSSGRERSMSRHHANLGAGPVDARCCRSESGISNRHNQRSKISVLSPSDMSLIGRISGEESAAAPKRARIACYRE